MLKMSQIRRAEERSLNGGRPIFGSRRRRPKFPTITSDASPIVLNPEDCQGCIAVASGKRFNVDVVMILGQDYHPGMTCEQMLAEASKNTEGV